MKRIEKYQKKILRYQKKISKYRVKLVKRFSGLKSVISKIGISVDEFKFEPLYKKEYIFPAHLGILFFENFDDFLFDEISGELQKVYPSFFFNIFNLGNLSFPENIFGKGIIKELKENSLSKLKLHPTDKFYQTLINVLNEKNLDMIIAITDLPLYSSSNNRIIFLFGEAHIKYHCCIVSTLKLKEVFYNRIMKRKLYKERLIKEIIHEIGHLIIGPEHCSSQKCIMKFSQKIEDTDIKNMSLCKDCIKKLEDIKRKYNF